MRGAKVKSTSGRRPPVKVKKGSELPLLPIAIGGILVVAAIILIIYGVVQAQGKRSPAVPTANGIPCDALEQTQVHYHAALQILYQGNPVSIPSDVGRLTTCFYWLHMHVESPGVIHIESPIVRVYTLGDFFDEWRQPLSRTQVAGVKGKVTAFFNGKPWTQDPRAIPLVPHASIQLDVGSPVVGAQVISWAGTNL